MIEAPTLEELQLKKKQDAVATARIVALLVFGASILAAVKGLAMTAPLAVAALFIWQNKVLR